jgi:hypothetical protein
MLRDHVRVMAFRRAIDRAVDSDTVVMDLGSGSGILAFMAVRAGARTVYAVEQRPATMALARDLASVNGLADRIDFIDGMSHEVASARLQPQPTVLVAEILGSAILEEKVLEFIIDARERLLAPDARIIPARLVIRAFAFDSGLRHDRRADVAALSELYGFDFSPLTTRLETTTVARTGRYNSAKYTVMSADAAAYTIDFHTVRDPGFTSAFTLEASADGDITSVCAYFTAHLDEETTLTNAPWAAPTHWNQLIFTLPAPRRVRRGDRLRMTLSYDGTLRCALMDSV